MTQDLGTLYDPQVRRCPYEFFSGLRTNAPVYQLPGTEIFLIAAHDIIKKVVRDTKTFSNELPEGQTSHHNANAAADRVLEEEGFGRRVKTIAAHDPPGHYGYRRLISAILSPAMVRAMEPTVREDVRALIAKIDASRPCDLVDALTLPLPLYVLSDMLGVDRADFLKFKDWAAASLYQNKPPQSEEALISDARAVAEMQHYLTGVIEDRRKNPRDDTVTKLVEAKLNGERPLTNKEILSTLELLLLAGAETTTNALGNGFLYMMDNPGVIDTIRRAPDRMADIAEEILRLESSVIGIWRNVTADTAIEGVAIPKGAKLLLAYGPSNWDEQTFDAPRRFDIDRPNMKENYAFGSGIHTCIGNEVARMEMRVVYGEFFKAFSNLTLAIDRDDVDYQPFLTLRGPAALPVHLTRA